MSPIEELQAELAALRSEVRSLRAAVSAPHQSAVEPQSSTPGLAARLPGGMLSRRSLLRAAPVAVAGAGLAASVARPAAAATADAVPVTEISGEIVVNAVPGNTGAASFNGPHYAGPTANDGGNSVYASAVGPGSAFVANVTDGYETLQNGSRQTDVGVGLTVTTAAGPAFRAFGEEFHTDADHVTTQYRGLGRAVFAESLNTHNAVGVVTGVNDGDQGVGVWGEQRSDHGIGFGVVGVAGAQGRGASFTGGAANMQLPPQPAPTHPSGGKAGDFFVDSSGRLWYCRQGGSGTGPTAKPGIWKQLA